jgi:hypothetical protein
VCSFTRTGFTHVVDGRRRVPENGLSHLQLGVIITPFGLPVNTFSLSVLTV